MPKKPAQWPSEKERPLILCHFSSEELNGMDRLQGGPSFDEYGIREYSKLGKIIKIPMIQQLFTQTLQYAKEHKGSAPPQLQEIYNKVAPQEPKFEPSKKENSYPQIEELKKKGIDGDDDLAWIPEDVAEFFIELEQYPKENPHTGFLMFGFLDGALDFLGTVGGAILGTMAGVGPIIGAGLGSAGSGLIQGRSGGDIFKGSLGAMGKTALFSGLGGMMGHAFPGMGAAASGILPAGLASTAGNFFNGPGTIMGGLGGMFGGAAANAAPTILASQVGKVGDVGAHGAANPVSGAAGAASPGGGLMGLLSNPWITMPLMGGLYMHGKNRESKNNRNQYQDSLNSMNSHRAETGMNKPWVDLPTIQRKPNPEFYNRSPMERQYGIYNSPFIEQPRRFAHGGHTHINHSDIQSHSRGALIKGPGKGQDDKINTTVPPNSYIYDATSVSSFGDGSSEAGGNILKRFEHDVKSRYGKPHREVIEERTRQLPVYLSNDEYKFDPTTVTAIGRGNNDRGAKVLKSMVIQLRKDKARNGTALAPKAKDPMHYMEQAFQELMKGKRHV